MKTICVIVMVFALYFAWADAADAQVLYKARRNLIGMNSGEDVARVWSLSFEEGDNEAVIKFLFDKKAFVIKEGEEWVLLGFNVYAHVVKIRRPGDYEIYYSLLDMNDRAAWEKVE